MTDSQAKLASSVLNFKCSYHPIYIDPSPEERVRMVENVGEQKVLEALNAREASIKMEAADPFRYGFEQDYWKDSDELLNQFPELVVLGGNRCLAGETVITDARTGKKQRLDSIRKPFSVLAVDMDQNLQVVVADAEIPFKKAKADLYKVNTSFDNPFICSGAHLVLNDRLEWVPISKMKPGDKLFHHMEDLEITSIEFVRNDYVWDFTVPKYHNYMIRGVIHHNSGKSAYAAKRVAQMFVGQHRGVNEWPDWVKQRCEKRGVRIWCLHTTAQSSIAMQQTLVYNNIPPELRAAKKNKFTNISYSQKNGFSEGTAVYNGNQIWFLNYSQDIKVVEGGEPDMIWCDELVPADWLETLRYRLVTRNGKLLVTFTPIQGYTKTVKDFISTAKVTDWKESELLPGQNIIGVPPGNMPYRARNVHGRHACIWFHSKLNPYNNWQRMVDTLKGRSSHDIKIRAYGWADATAGVQFPVFGEHNIFPLETLPSEGTNYFVVDPAGARNWFMLWGRVCAKGILWIYQEHPGQEYGEWSLPSDKADGKPGPAQRAGAGRGIDDYSELITSLDGEADIAERYIDPKAAGTSTITKEGGVTLLDLLATAKRPLYCIPAAGVTIDERVLLINDLLAFDRNLPMSDTNHPRLMISETCANLIYSMREWTGVDGQKGASKDPIDALGYLVVMSPQYVGGAKWAKWNKEAQNVGSY